jgi:alpha-tubulin suppressor-like RCC1 family protein
MPEAYQQVATPTPVPGVSGATQIAAGYDFACAVLNTGGVDCWGDDSVGQLGNGRDGYNLALPPQAVVGITNAVSVAAGYDGACALLSTGNVDCWGANGTHIPASDVPVPVAGLSGVTAVSAGYFYACALLGSGGVDCWGDAPDGSSSTPAPVPGITDATSISAGWFHACAALPTSHIECWGSDIRGQLGDLEPAPQETTPVEVLGIP